MTIRKLGGHESAKAHVEITDDKTVLVSYSTPVVIFDRNGWLQCTGTYSNTTRRHIGWFMREYGLGSYQTAKKLYEDNIKFNVVTGEVVDL